LINEYVEKGYIAKIGFEEKQGLWHGMNKGIELASGEFINFMNSDDYFCRDDAVEIVMSTILKANAQWGFGEAEIVDKDKSFILWHRVGYVPAFLFSSGCPCHQTVFMKTSIMREKGGFDTKYNTSSFSDNKIMIDLILDGIMPAISYNTIVHFRDGGQTAGNANETIHIDLYTKHMYDTIGVKWGLSLQECRELFYINSYQWNGIYGEAFHHDKKYAKALGKKIQLSIAREYYFKCFKEYYHSRPRFRLKWFVKMLLPYGFVRLVQRYRRRAGK
jgi:glycosyltransferase involved in cell wall biosynthesis